MPNVITANPLGTEKIGKLMLKYSIPSVVAIVVNSIYNLVDQIFIGQGVGYLGNAATNVIYPLITFTMAICMLIGDGAAAYLALNFGRGDVKEASKTAGNAMLLSVVACIVITILSLIFLEPICRLFGGTEASMPYCIEYGRMIALGFPFCAINSAYGSIIRADGRPRAIMIGLFIGTITNLILDPLFIFVFHMGVTGAGLATILGMMLNAIYFLFLIRKFTTLKIEKSYLIPSKPIVLKIFAYGLASFITQFATVVVTTIMNQSLVHYGALSKYGAEIPLAALGITLKVSMIVFGITLGIATGIQPILSFNYGSGQVDRLKKCLLYAMVSTTVIMCIAFVIFQVFPDKIVLLFGSDSDLYMEFSIKCFRVFLCACFCMGIGCVAGIFFQAICKPVQATFLSLLRQIIIFIPATLIGGRVLGLDGVLYAGPISDSLSAVVAIIVLAICWKGIFKTDSAQKQN